MKLGVSNTIPNIVNLPGQGGGGGGVDSGAFITEWTVGAGDTIILPSYSVAAVIDYDVDWGDTNSESNITTIDKTHTYADPGTYQVVITKQFGSLKMSSASAAQKLMLRKMVQWGTDNEWGALHSMFKDCTLMTYDATDFPNITNLNQNSMLREVFNGCTSVISLDLSMWTNTSNFGGSADTYRAFYNCTNCTLLDLTGWDVSNMQYFGDAFRFLGKDGTGCDVKLPNLNFASTVGVQAWSYMFYNAKFSSLDVSGWTLPPSNSVLLTAWMEDVLGSIAIDLSSWTNTSSITNMYGCFRDSEFTSINLTGWDTSNVTTFYTTFYNALNLLEIIGLNGLNSSAALTISYMCGNAKRLSFTNNNFGVNWGPNLGNCTTTAFAFYHCNSIALTGTAPNVSDWDTSSVTACANMFNFASFGTAPDVSNWDTSSILTFPQIFYVAKFGSGTIDISSWDLSGSSGSLDKMLRECDGGVTINADVKITSNITNLTQTFYSSPMLNGLNFNAASDFSGLTVASDMFGIDGLLTQADCDNLMNDFDATNSNAVVFGMGKSNFTAGLASKDNLVNVKGWVITWDVAGGGGPI